MISADSSILRRAFLTVLAGVLLGIGALFLAGVVERWIAAAWMSYKFSGFSSDGFITLSAKTALMYNLAAGLLFVLSYTSMVFARKRQMSGVGSMSKYASIAFIVAIILYVALGLSPLNQWRA